MAADFGECKSGGEKKDTWRIEKGQRGREWVREMAVSYANILSMATPIHSFTLASQTVLIRSASIRRSNGHRKRLRIVVPIFHLADTKPNGTSSLRQHLALIGKCTNAG